MEVAIGLILAIVTLGDVFDTVVVPGQGHVPLRIARRLIFLTLPLWRLGRSRRQGLSTTFAPFTLVSAFVIWMLLLTLAFSLMVHGLGHDFRPVVTSPAQALYIAGAGLVTVGAGGIEVGGAARWVLVASGFCGLAVVTMAVTYLLEVQSAIAARDAGILKLTTSAGIPPTGLALLERYGELDVRDELARIMRVGRDWCANVMQSHAAHPSLIYFRTRGSAAGWPATLGALMDVGLAAEFLLDAPDWRGPAVLLREEGGRMAHALIEMIGLDHAPQPPPREQVAQMCARLAAAGYAVRAEPDLDGFIAQRARHAACVSAMAAHLGSLDAPLIPPVSA